jgi:uncharacterized protein
LSPAREDISFRSDGAECGAWLYRPTGDARGSCVVMAHGFGATREARLDAYAERFTAAGHHALVFDYRHFGTSAGEPRQLISIRRQRTDWRAALAAARDVDGVDPQRLVAWGTSYGGGHVIDLAARESLAAAIAQTPFTDGRATAAAIPPATALRLTAATLRDVAAAALGVTPRMIPLVGPRGSLAAMTAPGSEAGYKALYPPERPLRNEFLPRAAATMPFWIPGRRAGRVRCPLLVQVAREDAITPARSACRVAARAPRGELLTYPGGHFDMYLGNGFERAVADQLSFLDRVV